MTKKLKEFVKEEYNKFVRIENKVAVFLGTDGKEHRINEESLHIRISNGLKYGKDVKRERIALEAIRTEKLKNV